MRIERILAREILDSRGFPTVEADVFLQGASRQMMGRAAVPSGASTGSFEALELRDNDKSRFKGKGVLQAIANIRDVIAPAIQGQVFDTQEELDAALIALDDTENKSKLGANALLAVSLAFARARAHALGKSLFETVSDNSKPYSMPLPLMNVINGGAHADNVLSVQEFMIVPFGFDRFSQALQCGSEVFHTLKELLKKQGMSTNVGDEGGFAPSLKSSRHALDCLVEAIEKAGYKPGAQVALAMDVAANELLHDGKYVLEEEGLKLTSDHLIQYYDQLVSDYPIVSIEDGLGEEDFAGWQALTQTLGSKVQLVGDDLFVTNPQRFARGIEQKMANAILVKVNQIGTLTESLQTIRMAQLQGYGVVVSHRSGETEDSFIADLAVGSGAGQIKTGSLARSDRVAKYNQLLRLEEAGAWPYAGRHVLPATVLKRVVG